MATQAIIPRTTENLAIRQDWESKLDLIKKTVAKDATNDELQLFLHQCHKTGLDPLARQIYFVKRQGKGTIQTGIDGYRLVADRTGKYAGNDDPEFDDPDNQPKWAKVTVYKIVDGVRCPFTASARWSQYYPGDAQGWAWKKMPHLMLGKCAEALALRKAFPAELSGVYTKEEMDQADTHSEQRPPAVDANGNEYPGCERCKNPIGDYISTTSGKVIPWTTVHAVSKDKFQGREYCGTCQMELPLPTPATPVVDAEPARIEPGEIEWNTDTEGIMCGTVTGIEQPAKGDHLIVKMGSVRASCFHKGRIREALTTDAPGQVCGFNVKKSKDGKYVNIESIVKIAGAEYSEDGTQLGV